MSEDKLLAALQSLLLNSQRPPETKTEWDDLRSQLWPKDWQQALAEHCAHKATTPATKVEHRYYCEKQHEVDPVGTREETLANGNTYSFTFADNTSVVLSKHPTNHWPMTLVAVRQIGDIEWNLPKVIDTNAASDHFRAQTKPRQ